MYSEIDQNKKFDSFFRCLEREFKCDGLFNFALAKEDSPLLAATQEDFELGQPKLEPEATSEPLKGEEEEDGHTKTNSETGKSRGEAVRLPDPLQARVSGTT